jgi:glycine cleavage system aminomethyltransferase T
VPSRYGDALMRRLMDKGAEFDVTPYGTEALGVMRIEKGHAAGNELNGTTTALNLGMGRMVSKAKDSIGSVLSRREGLNAPDALIAVGVKPIDPEEKITAGGHLMNASGAVNAAHDQGYVTSAAYSPTLGSMIGLAFLKNGAARHGEKMRIVSPVTKSSVRVEIVSAHFVDPEGERLRA